MNFGRQIVSGAVSLCMFAGGAAAAEEELLPKRQLSALTGIRQIQLEILTEGNGSSLVPDHHNKLREHLSKKLSDAGLRIGPSGSTMKDPLPKLVVDRHIALIKSNSGQPVGLSYAIDAFLVDTVKPERLTATTNEKAIVWKAEGAYGYISTREIPHLEKVAQKIAEEFVSDWRSAPREKIADAGIVPIELHPTERSINFASNAGDHYFGTRPPKDPPRVNVEAALELNRCKETIRALQIYIQHQQQQLALQQQQIVKLKRRRPDTNPSPSAHKPQPKPQAQNIKVGTTQTALDLFR